MSGHSKWSKIKHKKKATDKKKGKIFSKIAKMISVAARKGNDPETNPDLRMAIEKAKSVNMPNDNIEKAIQKGSGKGEEGQLEEMNYEAYGPNATPLIIKTMTDNKNRTLAEIKNILNNFDSKLAESGSVKYLFNKKNGEWIAKYTTELNNQKVKQQLKKLFEQLQEHQDVEQIYSNVNF